MALHGKSGKLKRRIFIMTAYSTELQIASKEYQHLASLVFQNSKNAILITNAKHKIILVNPVFTKITGYSLKEVYGKDPKIIKSGKHDRSFYQNLWHELMSHGYWQGTIWNRRKNGEIYPEWQTIRVARNTKGEITNLFAIFSDITDSKMLEEQLQRSRNYDALTDLPNKNLFIDRLAAAIKSIEVGQRELAVLLLNIDQFKRVNDAYGMPTGDIILKIVAQRVQSILQNDASFARISGDDYLILLPNIEKSASTLSTANRAIACFNEAFRVDKNIFNLQASIGIVVCSENTAEPEQLIKQANLAMEKSKKDKNNNIAFFEPSMDQYLKKQLAIENSLYQAIEKKELLIYYQPQVDAKTGKLIGAEALLRWNHPIKGILLPAEFISVTLNSGLIIPIGEWVLKTVCDQIAKWQKIYKLKIPIAVNISAIQFQQTNFPEQVNKIITTSKIDPKHLILELTEQVMIENMEENLQILNKLHDMGINISLDDFGTGFSSLSYLRKLPLSELKIDISFVQHIVEDNNSAVIAEMIIRMSKSLNLKTVAEGVETKSQLKSLQALGCDKIQGFYFSKPLPVDKFTELLKKNHCFNVQ